VVLGGPFQRANNVAEVEQKKHTFHKFTYRGMDPQPAAGRVLGAVDAAVQRLAAVEAQPGFVEETMLTAEALVQGQGGGSPDGKAQCG